MFGITITPDLSATLGWFRRTVLPESARTDQHWATNGIQISELWFTAKHHQVVIRSEELQ